jgi:adenosine deaminase
MSDLSWFERVPKVELHLHLEGAIPHEALWDLVCKYGGDPSLPDQESLRRRFEYRDFGQFVEAWVWKNGFLREYEDFTCISAAMARRLADQNIRYAEVFYSPADFQATGLEAQSLTLAIRRGLAQATGTRVALIADLVRDSGPASASRTLSEINEVRDLGVIGIGIGGSEHKFPPELFESVYAEARRRGFGTTAHAGEAAGAGSIWGAIRKLRVDRIGHGTRAEEDESLIDYLVDHQVPLEMCPISNLRTGVVRAYEDHPVRRFFDRSIIVTINTDDPAMFGNSLAEEYRLLAERFGFSRKEIRRLILNGIRAAWLSKEKREELEATFCADPAWEPDECTSKTGGA